MRQSRRGNCQTENDVVTHDLLPWLRTPMGGASCHAKLDRSLFLRDRPVYATAAITRAAAVTLPKIQRRHWFPFPSFLAECHFRPCESGQPAAEDDSVSARKERLLEFAFALSQSSTSLLGGATLKIDFICAAPDFFGLGARITEDFCLRLNGRV